MNNPFFLPMQDGRIAFSIRLFLQRQKHFPANDNYTSLRNRAGKGMEGGGVQGRRRSLLPARLRRSPRIGVERGVGRGGAAPPFPTSEPVGHAYGERCLAASSAAFSLRTLWPQKSRMVE